MSTLNHGAIAATESAYSAPHATNRKQYCLVDQVDKTAQVSDQFISTNFHLSAHNYLLPSAHLSTHLRTGSIASICPSLNLDASRAGYISSHIKISLAKPIVWPEAHYPMLLVALESETR